MTDEQKVRDAFEAWAADKMSLQCSNWRGQYQAQGTHKAWEAWQAALSHASATAEEGSVVGDAAACWSLAHRNSPTHALFADCIYDSEADALADANALNGETGDLIPVPLYLRPPRAAEDAWDAYRWRELCRQINASDPVSNEASTIRNIIDDAINLGSTCLDMHVDQAIAAKRGDQS